MESFLASGNAGQHAHPGEGMCTNCWNAEAAPGFEFCGKCVTEAINRQKETKANQNDPKKEREKVNRNNKIMEQINQAMENANLSEEEYKFILSIIPQEIQQDGTEILETLRGYKMSSNVKNKSRKVEQLVAGLIHLLYGYKTPAVIITEKGWYAPKFLKVKLEETSAEIQSRHKNNVNFLASSLSMMERLLGSCPDVKRTEKNAESEVCNRINEQFMKLNKKVKHFNEDEADEDEEDHFDEAMEDEDEKDHVEDAVGEEEDHIEDSMGDKDKEDYADDDVNFEEEEGSLPDLHRSEEMDDGVLIRRRDPASHYSLSPVVDSVDSENYENEIDAVDVQTTNSAAEKMRIEKKNLDAGQKIIAEASVNVITIPKEQSSAGKGIVIYQENNLTESPKPDAKGPSETANPTRVLPIRKMKGAQAVMFGRTPGQIEKRNCVTNQLVGKKSVRADQATWLQEGFEETSPTCGVGGKENSQEDEEPELGSVQRSSKIFNKTEFLKKLDVVIEEVVASSSEPIEEEVASSSKPIKKRPRLHYPKIVKDKKLKVLHPKNSQLKATKTEIEDSSIIQKSKLPAPPSSSPPMPADTVEIRKKVEEKKGGSKRKPEGGLQSEKKLTTMLSQKKTESVSSLESVVSDGNGGVQQAKKSTRGRSRMDTNTETPLKPVLMDTMLPSLKFVGEVLNRDEINDL